MNCLKLSLIPMFLFLLPVRVSHADSALLTDLEPRSLQMDILAFEERAQPPRILRRVKRAMRGRHFSTKKKDEPPKILQILRPANLTVPAKNPSIPKTAPRASNDSESNSTQNPSTEPPHEHEHEHDKPGNKTKKGDEHTHKHNHRWPFGMNPEAWFVFGFNVFLLLVSVILVCCGPRRITRCLTCACCRKKEEDDFWEDDDTSFELNPNDSEEAIGTLKGGEGGPGHPQQGEHEHGHGHTHPHGHAHTDHEHDHEAGHSSSKDVKA